MYLGKYNSPESRTEYARLVAELTHQSAPTSVTRAGVRRSDLTINELLLAYINWFETTRPATNPRSHRSSTSPRFALRTVREMFGALPITAFGPKALKALREVWVATGLSRKVINGRAGAVKRVFRWAVCEELAEPELFQRLQAVEGLRAGQSAAPDRPPVRPAVLAGVERTLPRMPAPVHAIVLLQIHSAARAGELVRLRVGDIDRTDPDVWTYTPAAHKGTWKGKSRVVYFGARCREILEPILAALVDPGAYLFSPERDATERNSEKRTGNPRHRPRGRTTRPRRCARRSSARAGGAGSRNLPRTGCAIWRPHTHGPSWGSMWPGPCAGTRSRPSPRCTAGRSMSNWHSRP
ncbi:catalytic phage domain protein : Integrase family protein OS=Planctomyces limnophilus (strain ATCC 43296 / DSM 3776 / IFAM 1008 / 290) GN=Plim_1106 PE=4 SV=1 [Gemmata massiliana]|uniref:Catalytic phage domain protein: Integrase family protein n=1 Tax=Gemmata massiliana TaxID=1210884 RepID=A0A6P2D4Y5_9BACT|nr:catalytic phage domain protein : Integrase family protein OS=Planctomyces limnophilus (strain ATCC 43296 / DSM 3776 / IFAM 1008 / 290) GN=Plim_1106 PE=4 SV=1 [Gemmata massiliana]